MPDDKIPELQDSFEHFLQVFLTKRSEEGTLALLGSKICGFSTGSDEVAHNLSEAKALLARDFQQAPHPFKVTVHFVHPQQLSKKAGFVQAQLDISTQINERKITLKNLRITTVFEYEHGRWELQHMHISLPSVRQQKGEAWPIAELEERTHQLEQMVSDRTHELRVALNRLKVLATTDKLTDLHNRAHFDEEIKVHFEHLRRYNNTASLVLLDIDHFKQVNDTYGHQFGDQVLKELAELTRAHTRSVDTLARWGGEEFILLLPETDIKGAKKYAEKLRKAVRKHDFQTLKPLTISLGIAEYAGDKSYSNWLRRTDDALYQAKDAGRNCSCSG